MNLWRRIIVDDWPKPDTHVAATAILLVYVLPFMAPFAASKVLIAAGMDKTDATGVMIAMLFIAIPFGIFAKVKMQRWD